MVEAHDATTMALGLSEQFKERESRNGADDIEKVWDVSALSRSTQRSSSALERLNLFACLLHSLC